MNKMVLNYLKNLNKEQSKAITFKNGPLLIIAGAGTGKTTVITRRLAYLISKKIAHPQEILALTFTEKAAQEMEERVDTLLPFGYLDLWISTFHSFCQRILKESAINIGLPGDFKVLDKTDAWLLLRQNLEGLKLDYYKPLGNPTKFIHTLVEHFLRLKDQGIDPMDYQKYVGRIKDSSEIQKTKELVRAYKAYQNILIENNALDFGDLINYAILLFKKRPAILEKYRKQFKYILVDEFQDTNWAQYELVKMLAAPKNNLTVCGDDKQAIYRWRGASFDNIFKFKKDYPHSKKIFLWKNYRSGQNILNLAYKFIQLNNFNYFERQLGGDKKLKKISKKLLSQVGDRGIIKHFRFETLEEETRGVADKIEEILDKKLTKFFSDFAVLVRANDYGLPFVKEFERRGFPYQFVASSGLYNQPIILDVISYFRILDSYYESPALYRILKSPIFAIYDSDIVKITNFSKIKTLSLYEALENISLVDGIAHNTKQRINFLIALIEKHSKTAALKNISAIFINFLNDSGYLKYLLKNNCERDIELLNQFFSKIRQFEENQINPCLKDFIERIDFETESGDSGKLDFDIEKGPDAIKIMTVHSAKGLEFPFVFLVNLVDKRFPTIERGDAIEVPLSLRKDIMLSGDVHLEEERRLFYVAMTRAKKALFFTWAADCGGYRRKKPSRFLYELGMDKAQQKNPQPIFFRKNYQTKKKGEKLSLPPHFSFTQITAFNYCPLQYKYAHILKIPKRETWTLSFGKTMHNTLFRFMQEFYQRQNWGLKDVYKVYDKEWIDEWYVSKKDKERYYSRGKKSLKRFTDDLKNKKPKIKLINDAPALEVSFSLKIGKHTLRGKIDRIDDLGSSDVEIIDYKTGRSKERLTPEEKEQLLIYQVAAQDVLKMNPKKLTYYYLDESKKVNFFPSKKEKNDFQKYLMEKMREIEKSEFLPTPGRHCKFCDFREICEFRKIN